jgi:cyanoexosortase A
MNRLLDHLPPSLRKTAARIPPIPPGTPRNLWLLLAGAVALQNLAVFHTSQTDHTAVFALLVWGGALICFEDQIESLDPKPVLVGLITGTVLLLWVMARTAVVLHWDGILFALAPLAGLALALLCRPPGDLKRFLDPLLCLLMLPLFALLMRLFPEYPLSLLTARIAGIWLGSLGLDVAVSGRDVMLPGGGVEVMGACNGLDMIAQIVCVAIIFLLAFRIRSKISRLILMLAAPLIGLVCNTIRIALLAIFAGQGQSKGSFLFDFFHKDGGSLVFSGVAVFVFGVLYMRLLERELPPLPAASLPNQEP